MHDLGDKLREIWELQTFEGFVLPSDDYQTREVFPDDNDGKRHGHSHRGLHYRVSWIPHREIRGNVEELQKRGIMVPADEKDLFYDERDSQKRHCFLCPVNIVTVNPKERLLPMKLGEDQREFLAGANFSWITREHYTVMFARHVDQELSPGVLHAMVDLYRATKGTFRVIFNGRDAGASIPWHLHFQVTSERLPIEELPPGTESCYPLPFRRFPTTEAGISAAYAAAARWLAGGRSKSEGGGGETVNEGERRQGGTAKEGEISLEGVMDKGEMEYGEEASARGQAPAADVDTATPPMVEITAGSGSRGYAIATTYQQPQGPDRKHTGDVPRSNHQNLQGDVSVQTQGDVSVKEGGGGNVSDKEGAGGQLSQEAAKNSDKKEEGGGIARGERPSRVGSEEDHVADSHRTVNVLVLPAHFSCEEYSRAVDHQGHPGGSLSDWTCRCSFRGTDAEQATLFPSPVCDSDEDQLGMPEEAEMLSGIQHRVALHPCELRPTRGCIYVFPRDRRLVRAQGKGLVGGFEAGGLFALSAPSERRVFEAARAHELGQILRQVCPVDVDEFFSE
eukprot:jgi/Mesvir1/16310/Mv12762-RA.1